MASRPFLVPGEYLREVFEWLAENDEPLLRGPRPGDQYSVRVRVDSAGDYVLEAASDEDGTPDDEEMASIQTWGQMADYLGMDVAELVEKACAAGHPEPDDPDDDEDEDDAAKAEDREISYEDADLGDPYFLLEFLTTTGSPTLDDLLDGIPDTFAWDPATEDPGLPPGKAGDQWLANGRSVDGVSTTDERQGPVTWISSPIGLSCLQYALDRLGRQAWIDLE